jgi:predicted porin
MKEVILKDNLKIVKDDFNNHSKYQHIPIFIYINLGISNLSSSQNNSILIPISTDKSGMTYEFGLGYNYSSQYFTTISFEKITTNEKDIENITLSANYKFDKIYLTPSIGLLAGYSTLLWTKDPVVSSEKQRKSTKYFLGIQGQIEYKMDKQFSILNTYKYIPYEHKTNIKNGGYLNDDSAYNFMIGLKYNY